MKFLARKASDFCKRGQSQKIMTCAWGEHGAAACAVEGLAIMILRCGALKTDVLDTVGAGDSFNGAFVAALASGDDAGNDGALGRALRVASHVAGQKVGRVGFAGLRPIPVRWHVHARPCGSRSRRSVARSAIVTRRYLVKHRLNGRAHSPPDHRFASRGSPRGTSCLRRGPRCTRSRRRGPPGSARRRRRSPATQHSFCDPNSTFMAFADGAARGNFTSTSMRSGVSRQSHLLASRRRCCRRSASTSVVRAPCRPARRRPTSLPPCRRAAPSPRPSPLENRLFLSFRRTGSSSLLSTSSSSSSTRSAPNTSTPAAQSRT